MAGIACPHCRRTLRAHDVEPIDGALRLICGGCHRDLLVVEIAP
jgi:hypothetical protein